MVQTDRGLTPPQKSPTPSEAPNLRVNFGGPWVDRHGSEGGFRIVPRHFLLGFPSSDANSGVTAGKLQNLLYVLDLPVRSIFH